MREDYIEQEAAVASSINALFAAQLTEAMRRNIQRTLDFAWLNDSKWVDQATAAVYQNAKVVMQMGAATAQEIVGIGMSDFITRPQVLQALNESVKVFANNIGHSTAQMLAESLGDGIKAGEDLAALTRRVEEVFDGGVEKWRAARIARSEVWRAHNNGEIELWRETGVVEKIVWDASPSACVFCLQMNGTVIHIGETFFDKGDIQAVTVGESVWTLKHDYMTVKGPPLHPNCRCGLRPILAPIGA